MAALALSTTDLETITFASIQLAVRARRPVDRCRAWLLHQRGPINRSPETLKGVHSLGVVFLLAVATAHLPIVVAPALLTPLDVAAFAVAFRVAGLATTVLTRSPATTPRAIPGCWLGMTLGGCVGCFENPK